jgi:hypothetical protein
MENLDVGSWTKQSDMEILEKVDSGEQNNGRRAMKFTTNDGSSAKYFGQVVDVEPGSGYVFSAWSKMIDYKGYSRVVIKDSSGTNLYHGLVGSVDFYKPLEIEIQNPAGNDELDIRFYVYPDENGVAGLLVDDVILSRTDVGVRAPTGLIGESLGEGVSLEWNYDYQPNHLGFWVMKKSPGAGHTTPIYPQLKRNDWVTTQEYSVCRLVKFEFSIRSPIS